MLKFVAIFIALSQWLAIAQQINDYAGDCGKLNEKYLLNFYSTPAVDEFPWIGRVYYEGENFAGFAYNRYIFRCVAVLISKRHLLIPANCVAETPTRKLELYAVILGADNRCYKSNSCPSPVPNYYEIDQIALHPNLTFDRNNVIIDNNVGIITLKSDANYNAEVSPICLPSKENGVANFVGQNLYYAGYTYDFEPLKARGHVASLQNCREFDRNVHLGDSYMCVIPYMREQQELLTGSPLMGVATVGSPARPTNFYLIGLAALNIGFNEDLRYNVVSIGHYIEWIRFNIA